MNDRSRRLRRLTTTLLGPSPEAPLLRRAEGTSIPVLLWLNGLRVSEACATSIEALGIERGHHTLRIVGKGNKPATVPLVPRAARTIDLAVAERHEGPRPASRPPVGPLDREACRRGSVHPHVLRAACIMALDAGSHCETSRSPLVTPTPEPRPSASGAARTSTAAPPRSWSPSSSAAEPGPTERGTSAARQVAWLCVFDGVRSGAPGSSPSGPRTV
jgi:integrase/recombinase XerD